MRYNRNFIFILLSCLLWGCAQMGVPSGGDKDVAPPEILPENMVPRNGSTGFSSQRIYIECNEYIRLQPGRQPVISPPLFPAPEISVKGKRIIIDLEEVTLQPNTTYSIHFPAMIADITEGNIREDFTYVFSTGDHLDTGTVNGKLINATNHSAFSKAWMLLYADTVATPLKKSIPAYLARSKPDGSFSVEHIRPGTYRAFALADINNNLKYDLAAEWIAFSDSTLTVGSTPVTLNMQLFKQPDKKIKVTTDISLSSILHKVIFNQPVNQLQVHPYTYTDNFRAFKTISGDSSVFVSFQSPLTDTAYFQILSDTTVVDSFYILPDRNKKFDYSATPPVNKLLMPNENLVMVVNEWSVWDSTKVRVEDTVTQTTIKNVTLVDGIFPTIIFPHTEDGCYRVSLEKGALTGLRNVSDSAVFYCKWLAPEKYGTLQVVCDFSAYTKQGSRVVVELFRASPVSSDTVRLSTASGNVFFKTVRAGSYSLRAFVDVNGDKRWTTGNLENNRQPEPSFVYPQMIQIRANWDLELNWKPE